MQHHSETFQIEAKEGTSTCTSLPVLGIQVPCVASGTEQRQALLLCFPSSPSPQDGNRRCEATLLEFLYTAFPGSKQVEFYPRFLSRQSMFVSSFPAGPQGNYLERMLLSIPPHLCHP